MDNRHCSLPQLRLQARGTSPIGGPNKGAERKQPHPVKQPFYHETIEALEAAAEAFVRDSQFCEHLLKSSMDRWPQDPRVGVGLAEAIIAFANAFSALAELRDACAAANEDFGNRVRLRRDLVPHNGAGQESGMQIIGALFPWSRLQDARPSPYVMHPVQPSRSQNARASP